MKTTYRKRLLSLALVLAALLTLSTGALAADTAVVSRQKLTVDGADAPVTAYNIDGYNYFKLRDVACLLNGTSAQFSVRYDEETNSILIVTGEAYTANGSELQPMDKGDRDAVKSVQTLYINGEKVSSLAAYNIEGYNYFKLRDLGTALGFSVDYDQDANTMLIITPETAQPPAAGEWDFTVQVERSEQEYKAEDGTVIATEAVERPVLRLVNADGEVFSGSEPERGVTARQLTVCKTFNDAAAGVWDIDIEEEGRTIYELRKGTDSGMPPVGREITVAEIHRHGSLLSVLEGEYAYLGGAHPDYGLCARNYDLSGGKFVELMDLTDRPEELREAIVCAVAEQICTSEYREGFYDDWYDLLLKKESFEVFFGGESITVFFQEYDLAPHAVGVPRFEIPYGSISRFLNGYGEQLLELPMEAKVIGDFHEAQSLWSWLVARAPVDYDDVRTEGDIWYCRVDDPNVRTLADVKEMLSRYVDADYVEEQLAGNGVLREFDGVLYAASVGRGDDITIASVDYAAQLSGEGGKVIVTIHRQDYDDTLEDWVLTGETDILEFPFTLRGGHAVFLVMEPIY